MKSYFMTNAIVDGKVVQVRLPASMLEMFKKPEPAPPPPATNGVWTVGDRVMPIGWSMDKKEYLRPVATVIVVTEHGVEVEFGPDVTGDGTIVPFHFVNDCVEAA